MPFIQCDTFMKSCKIVLVGAGRVATQLGKALVAAGYPVLQVYSRTQVAATTLADSLAEHTGFPVEGTISLAEIRKDADLYIVALKDSALPELLPVLVQGRSQGLFVHTAGSVPMDIWKGLTPRYGVFYPMQTFSKERSVDFATVPFFLEADSAVDLQCLRTIAEHLGSKVYEVSSEQRKYLHIAAVFACNFANHMYALSAELLAKQGLPFETMLALVDETARKVHELPPVEAQTGPAVRYDQNVIQRHLEMLSDEPVMQELYEKVSQSIHWLDGRKHEEKFD